MWIIRVAVICVTILFCRDVFATDPVASVDIIEVIDSVKIAPVSSKVDDTLFSDTESVKKNWWKEMVRGRVDFNNSEIHYPKFVRFCKDVYVWGDKTFNSYDPEYVVPTGKNWKVVVKSNNWFDSYVGRPLKNTIVSVHSRMTSNIGAQISFMAVSLGYMLDIDDMFSGSTSKKADFSFTCARFAADAYYMKNEGAMTLVKFGDYVGNKRIHGFNGVKRSSRGASIYYFFNNKKYAQAAAFCYSKIQKKSAGSFILGLSIDGQDLQLDFNSLPEEIVEYSSLSALSGRLRYNDYCLVGGYAHNWVLPHNWLINATFTPYFGVKHLLDHSIDKSENLFSANFRFKMGVVKNNGNFFYALQGYIDGHNYGSNMAKFYNSIEDITVMAGFRF